MTSHLNEQLALSEQMEANMARIEELLGRGTAKKQFKLLLADKLFLMWLKTSYGGGGPLQLEEINFGWMARLAFKAANSFLAASDAEDVKDDGK